MITLKVDGGSAVKMRVLSDPSTRLDVTEDGDSSVMLRVLGDPVTKLDVTEAVLVRGSDAQEYGGAYIVSPDFERHKLPTANKHLSKDITVEAIEVARTTNPSGGKTVYIGGII